MIIGICGLGYTGSGAIVDLLKEYEETECPFDGEFPLAFFPDGLEDLEYHIMKTHSRYMSCDVALLRFEAMMKTYSYPREKYSKLMGERYFDRVERYIKNITQVEWLGFWGFDSFATNEFKRTFDFRILYRIYRWINKVYKRPIRYYPNRVMRLSINNDIFYAETKLLVHDLLIGMGCNPNKKTILNQPFAGDNPENSMKFYYDARAIVVLRDPRDIYISAKSFLGTEATWIPTETVEQFTKYYRIIMKNRLPKFSNDNILIIRFEDLIYNYGNTIQAIEVFLELKKHNSKHKFFQPVKSINNTQLFNTYLEYEGDIKYIEKELKEYLYPFEKFGKRISNKNCF